MRWMRTVALALAAVFLSSLAAAQTSSLGPVFLVSEGREFPAFSHAAMAPGGDFVVVWDSRGSTGPDRVWMRRFAPNGKPRGRQVLVGRSGGAGARQTFPRVAMAPDGAFMIVWQSGNSLTHNAVYGRCFTPGGKPFGPPFKLAVPGQPVLQFNPDVAAAPDGSFVTTWASGPNPFGLQAEILARRFDTDGSPLSPVLTVPPDAGWQNYPRVAVSGNGDFLIGWLSYQPDSRALYDLKAQRFDAGGHPLGDRLQVSPSSNTITSDNSLDVAMTDDGEALFTWVGYVPDAPPTSGGFLAVGVLGQRLTADMTRTGDPVKIDDSAFSVQEPPVVAAIPEGGYFVAWKRYEYPSVIFAQRLSEEGTPQGPVLQINPADSGIRPAVALAANGRGVVTWTAANSRRSWISARLLTLAP